MNPESLRFVNANRKIMGGKKSVFEVDSDVLLKDYDETGSVKEAFKRHDINYTGTQISNFCILRESVGHVERKFIFGMAEDELIILIRQYKDECNCLPELIRKIGLTRNLQRISIPSKLKNKFIALCENNDIDLGNFSDQKKRTNSVKNKGLTFSDEEVFRLDTMVSHQTVKKRFLSKVEYKCSECSIEAWNNRPLSLQMDHIDGNCKNNAFHNLRLLCPNCHSQTDNFGGKTRL